ncbi:hypothetical protein D3C76_1805530 [compost metagenome]
MTPWVKYFWINGYSTRIGTVATMMVAYFTTSPRNGSPVVVDRLVVSPVLFSMRISRSTSCRGNISRSRR